MHKLGMSLVAGAMMVGALGCDDGAADTAENAGRCQRICNALEKCPGDLDVGKCRTECKNESKDESYEAQAKECSQCVDRNNSCVEDAFACADECAPLWGLASQ